MRSERSYLVVFAVCVLSVYAEAGSAWHWGRCPGISVQQSFNVTEYLDTWYEQATYNAWFLEGSQRCVNANYSLESDDHTIAVVNRGISKFTNKWVGINGTAVEDDSSKHEGKLTVTFKPAWWLTVMADYWVLATDYNLYSVVYTCTSHMFFFHEYTIWFLSRDQQFPSDVEEKDFLEKANNALRNRGLDPSIMSRSDQSYCDVNTTAPPPSDKMLETYFSM